MVETQRMHGKQVARLTGAALLGLIGLGVLAGILVSGDININMSLDAARIIDNMATAEGRVYGKAWIAAGSGLVSLLIAVGLYTQLRGHGPVVALWSLLVAATGTIFALQSGLETLKIATVLSSDSMAAVPAEALRSLQVAFLAGDYAAFHLSLVINSVAMAGFFWLFIRSRAIPAPIALWGLFASCFVTFTIVARDFIPVLGHSAITISFILSNLIAQLALGLYLLVRGVRY